MSHLNIVFLDRATIPSHITIPAPKIQHNWTEYSATKTNEVFERVKDANVVITNKVVLGREVLAQLPNLKLIAVSATGYNNVDIDACRDLGITVCNVQGYSVRSVPEHVIGSIYALRRNLFAYHKDIQNGEWQRSGQFCFFTHPIGDVAGLTLGMIGYGALGEATASLAKAIGMQVLVAERKGQVCRDDRTPFEDVLKRSDVISLHCPLSAETENLIAAPELELMSNHSLLINAGRGGLVDELALVEALKTGKIGGAAVDVFTTEPAGQDNPLIQEQPNLPNLLLTPHVAWGSDSSISRLCQILIENIDAYYRGEPQNTVV